MQRLIFALFALFLAATASATTVRRASVDQLVLSSDVIVHAVVRSVDDHLATTVNGPFLTAIELELLETVRGLEAGTSTLQLIIPGGRAFDRVMKIPGMPQLQEGDEVVLILEATDLGYIYAGLGQGVFHVQRAAGGARVFRDLGEVKLVGEPGAPAALPNLESLLGHLRDVAGGAK